MFCNKITQPVEFTKEQIAECEKCKHASGKKIWCCLFGAWIKEPSRIITPNKKIQYPSKLNMAKSFVKGAAKHVKSRMKKRSNIEQAKCIAICAGDGQNPKCEWYVPKTKVGPRCQKCGCCMNIKTRWATAHCPINKW